MFDPVSRNAYVSIVLSLQTALTFTGTIDKPIAGPLDDVSVDPSVDLT